MLTRTRLFVVLGFVMDGICRRWSRLVVGRRVRWSFLARGFRARRARLSLGVMTGHERPSPGGWFERRSDDKREHEQETPNKTIHVPRSPRSLAILARYRAKSRSLKRQVIAA